MQVFESEKHGSLAMSAEELRSLTEWHREYRPGWDDDPEQYSANGLVGWGRSRRLGLFRRGRYKAYIGVQHVDPDRPGWRIVDEPRARFFASLFVDGSCVTLRTFPTISAAFEMLGKVIEAE